MTLPNKFKFTCPSSTSTSVYEATRVADGFVVYWTAVNGVLQGPVAYTEDDLLDCFGGGHPHWKIIAEPSGYAKIVAKLLADKKDALQAQLKGWQEGVTFHKGQLEEAEGVIRGIEQQIADINKGE
jgi:hypothetical protein